MIVKKFKKVLDFLGKSVIITMLPARTGDR